MPVSVAAEYFFTAPPHSVSFSMWWCDRCHSIKLRSTFFHCLCREKSQSFAHLFINTERAKTPPNYSAAYATCVRIGPPLSPSLPPSVDANKLRMPQLLSHWIRLLVIVCCCCYRFPFGVAATVVVVVVVVDVDFRYFHLLFSLSANVCVCECAVWRIYSSQFYLFSFGSFVSLSSRNHQIFKYLHSVYVVKCGTTPVPSAFSTKSKVAFTYTATHICEISLSLSRSLAASNPEQTQSERFDTQQKHDQTIYLCIFRFVPNFFFLSLSRLFCLSALLLKLSTCEERHVCCTYMQLRCDIVCTRRWWIHHFSISTSLLTWCVCASMWSKCVLQHFWLFSVSIPCLSVIASLVHVCVCAFRLTRVVARNE